MPYTLSAALDSPFATTLAATREALVQQGFGILTEIDLAATLKAKLDVDIEPYVILGACRPPLAFKAVQADPSIGALLPCNVVVRATGPHRTVVEAVDPDAMLAMSESEALKDVAADARIRLVAALDTLDSSQS
ncbi:DUF302 domain-containing protein [soil metagenome]